MDGDGYPETWDEAVAALERASAVEITRPSRQVTIDYRTEDGTVTATSPEITGFRVSGQTLDEAREAAREALGPFLDPAVKITERQVIWFRRRDPAEASRLIREGLRANGMPDDWIEGLIAGMPQ